MNFSFDTLINKFKGLLGKNNVSRVARSPVKSKEKLQADRALDSTPASISSKQAIKPEEAAPGNRKRAKARSKKRKAARGGKGK